MIREQAKDLHINLIDDYLELRENMKKKDAEEIKFSYKDYVTVVFQNPNLLDLLIEEEYKDE